MLPNFLKLNLGYSVIYKYFLLFSDIKDILGKTYADITAESSVIYAILYNEIINVL